jgi:Ca2+-binding EF-hand superfamily protein
LFLVLESRVLITFRIVTEGDGRWFWISKKMEMPVRGKSPIETKESIKMFKTIKLFVSVLLPFGALVVTAGLIGAQDDPPSPQAALAAYDTDKDGTIDENEAKAAAGAVFDKLDVDKDGTLDEKELQGRLTSMQFREADPDHDNTLTKDEYVVFVAKAFRRANRDTDGTLDARELQAPAGRAFLLILR